MTFPDSITDKGRESRQSFGETFTDAELEIGINGTKEERNDLFCFETVNPFTP